MELHFCGSIFFYLNNSGKIKSMKESFLEQSWKDHVESHEKDYELLEADKALSVFLKLEEEVSKIKNKKDKEEAEEILNGMKGEVVRYISNIKTIETSSGWQFETQKDNEYKRRERHNSVLRSLLSLYRYLRKHKLDTSWAEDLGYDDDARDDLEKFDRWEITNWAMNLNESLNSQNQKIN